MFCVLHRNLSYLAGYHQICVHYENQELLFMETGSVWRLNKFRVCEVRRFVLFGSDFGYCVNNRVCDGGE